MKTIRKYGILTAFILSIGAIVITALNALAASPVLTITPFGTNQYSIIITNGLSTTNYTLFWTPILADPNYPWQVVGVGSLGQTNFAIDAGDVPNGFFRILVGADSDADGIPDWLDADPLNPNVGILDLTINVPANGSVLQ